MAVNMHKKYTEGKTRQWEVPVGTRGGDYVINTESGQVGVALADAGGSSGPANIAGVTGGTVPTGGVGYKTPGAVVAVDGTWRWTITGAANGETVLGTGTPVGTPVFQGADARTVTLTGTVGTDVLIGTIDDGNIVNGVGPVLIGAVL